MVSQTMRIVQPGFGFICETDGRKVLLEKPLSPFNSNMWDINYLHMSSEVLKCGKTIQYSQNVYQMTTVQPVFGFICETDGGKVLLEEPLSPPNSNMWDIVVCISAVRGWNKKKKKTVFTKWLSNGNCTTWILLHMWNRMWESMLEEPLSPNISNMSDIFICIWSVRG